MLHASVASSNHSCWESATFDTQRGLTQESRSVGTQVNTILTEFVPSACTEVGQLTWFSHHRLQPSLWVPTIIARGRPLASSSKRPFRQNPTFFSVGWGGGEEALANGLCTHCLWHNVLDPNRQKRLKEGGDSPIDASRIAAMMPPDADRSSTFLKRKKACAAPRLVSHIATPWPSPNKFQRNGCRKSTDTLMCSL